MKRWNVCWLLCVLLAVTGSATGCASRGGGRQQVNVMVVPQHRDVQRVAVMPFRASTELIGSSVSDIFVTELLKTHCYDLIERSQLTQVLGETEVALSGLTAGQAAQVGQMIGADAVIVGTVSEYENVAQRGHALPVVGVSVRMIDSTTSRILWSVDHAGRGRRGTTLAQQSRGVVGEMVTALSRQIR